jgi:hypothetical protein
VAAPALAVPAEPVTALALVLDQKMMAVVLDRTSLRLICMTLFASLLLQVSDQISVTLPERGTLRPIYEEY